MHEGPGCIFDPRIDPQHAVHKEVQAAHHQRESDDSECFRGVAVRFSGTVPVCYQLVGQLIPEEEAEEDWYQAEE